MSSNTREVVFGDLTQEEVLAGLHAEAAAIATRGLALRLDETKNGSPEQGEALHNFLLTQGKGDLRAHVRLVGARLQVAESLRVGS